MPPLALVGVVTKAGAMRKTATVSVSKYIVHAKTGKRLERSKKYLTHDENNSLRVEDTVVIRHCRPLSARKRFTLERVIKSPEAERLAALQATTRQQAAAAKVPDTPTITVSLLTSP